MEFRAWRHFDWVMLLVTLLLAAYGVAMIYSATLGTEGGIGLTSLAGRQLIYNGIGLFIMLAIAATDYRLLRTLAPLLYGTTIVALALVQVLGRIAHGSQRSFALGFFDLQPSEPAKLVLTIMLARFLASRANDIGSARTVVYAALIAAVPAVLTLIQPDLGTTLVLVAVFLGIIFVAGLRRLHAFIGAAVALVCAPAVWFLLPSYMRDRVYTFLDPYARPLDEGYNVIQAFISVGSGGVFGRGFTSGTQSQLHFLRVQYADFIFSVLAEELGFIGALVLLFLFVVLFIRGLRAALIARDGFGRLLCVGVVSNLAFQAFVNVGVNVGLLPVTGVTLPLISYGGSSVLTVFAGLGILQSVAMRHKRFEF